MAYQITCDNGACARVVASGDEGRPSLVARRRVYCDRCQAVVEAVELELRREGHKLALGLAGELEERRKELMREMMPPQITDAEADLPPRAGIAPAAIAEAS